FDISGRLLLTKHMENTASMTIAEVKRFNSGLYIVKVVVNGKMVVSTKVVKK
nr:T9SS type A sorting domain-containing protein [Serratia sp. PAMC26656]